MLILISTRDENRRRERMASREIRIQVRRQLRAYIAAQLGRPTRALRVYRNYVPQPLEELITSSVDAITADPNPNWQETNTERLSQFQRRVIEQIPSLLSEIPRYPESIMPNTFDVLHSISDILDKICPFEKPRAPRRP
jgi:hypothetical protein